MAIKVTKTLELENYFESETADGIKYIVGQIKLSELCKLNEPGWNDENVRDPKMHPTKAVRGIRRTLRECPQTFFLKHNGVCICAKEIRIENGEITFIEPGIVNGGHTATEAFAQGPHALHDSAKVLITAITSPNDTLRIEIAEGRNTAKGVSDTDLIGRNFAPLEYVAEKYNDEYREQNGVFMIREGMPPSEHDPRYLVEKKPFMKNLSAWGQTPHAASGSSDMLIRAAKKQLEFYTNISPKDVWLLCNGLPGEIRAAIQSLPLLDNMTVVQRAKGRTGNYDYLVRSTLAAMSLANNYDDGRPFYPSDYIAKLDKEERAEQFKKFVKELCRYLEERLRPGLDAQKLFNSKETMEDVKRTVKTAWN
jgi:hypothetical protein